MTKKKTTDSHSFRRWASVTMGENHDPNVKIVKSVICIHMLLCAPYARLEIENPNDKTVQYSRDMFANHHRNRFQCIALFRVYPPCPKTIHTSAYQFYCWVSHAKHTYTCISETSCDAEYDDFYRAAFGNRNTRHVRESPNQR